MMTEKKSRFARTNRAQSGKQYDRVKGQIGVCVCGEKRTYDFRLRACDSSLESSWQMILIREKKSRFARPARLQRAKMCSAHYISHLKTTDKRDLSQKRPLKLVIGKLKKSLPKREECERSEHFASLNKSFKV